MYPTSFDYLRASTVDEAIRLLGAHDDARLLAGGHSLLPMMKLRLAAPAVLVDIGRCAELVGIRREGRSVHVGPLTTHDAIATSSVLAADCPLLAAAAAQVGDQQVRNRGTIGGNIAHADPASDLPAALVAAGATFHLRGPGGGRSVAAGSFFVDLLTTDLRAGELIVDIELPVAGAGSGAAYRKVAHPASGYAVCGAAAIVGMAEGRCTGATLVFNGVTVTPLVADVGGLVGGECSDGTIAEALSALDHDDPLGDLHASGEYRLQLARVYGARALAAARDRVGAA